ncbi:MAG: hypothetical protein JW862_12805 [Anaerolineales bacterium]|nr:hypothetical protein [Anaerolineales bacterium]
MVEIVNTRDRLETYQRPVESAIEGGMSTLEIAQVCFYRKKS